jgi:hypothetical protein
MVVLAGCVVYLAHALHYRSVLEGHCVDDAYISYRYAQNLAEGAGLVFNPGERVEGYSNFLWVLLHTPALRFGWNPELVSHGLALLCGVLVLLLVVHALRRRFGVHNLWLIALALALSATSGYFAAWSVAGLETSLFTLLLLALWYRFVVEQEEQERSWLGSALLSVALLLTRPEGIYLALGMVAVRLVLAWRSETVGARRSAIALALLVGAVALGYEAWRFLYYGPQLFPNSVRAKVGFGLTPILAGFEYVARHFLWPYAPFLLALLLPGRRRLATASAGALLIVYLLFVIGVGGDWSYGRMFVTVLPFGTLLLVAGVARWERARAWCSGRRGRIACVVLATLYIALAFDVTGRQREVGRWRTYQIVDLERIAIGKWLAQEMPPDARVAVYAAGQIPFYSGLYAHDMLGLNDPHIAGLELAHEGKGIPGHDKWDVAWTMEQVKPDIIVEGRLIPGLHRHPAWRTQYHLVRGFWTHQEVAMRRDLVERLRQSGSLPRP